jgi:hypothetical protein
VPEIEDRINFHEAEAEAAYRQAYQYATKKSPSDKIAHLTTAYNLAIFLKEYRQGLVEGDDWLIKLIFPFSQEKCIVPKGRIISDILHLLKESNQQVPRIACSLNGERVPQGRYVPKRKPEKLEKHQTLGWIGFWDEDGNFPLLVNMGESVSQLVGANNEVQCCKYGTYMRLRNEVNRLVIPDNVLILIG